MTYSGFGMNTDIHTGRSASNNYQNTKDMFINRTDAGRKLADALMQYKSRNPIVFGIPRGGVVTGYEVADRLQCEFSVIITKKLGYLSNPEIAFGALAEDKSLILQSYAPKKLSKEEIETVIKIEEKEIKRRKEIYRGGKELPLITKKAVILVDDGIATGSTMMAAIDMCRKKSPDTIVVASPVCSAGMMNILSEKADDVVILDIPDDFIAVSQVYEVFDQITDEEVSQYMMKADRKRSKPDTLLPVS